jgi:hypothetical protein
MSLHDCRNAGQGTLNDRLCQGLANVLSLSARKLHLSDLAATRCLEAIGVIHFLIRLVVAKSNLCTIQVDGKLIEELRKGAAQLAEDARERLMGPPISDQNPWHVPLFFVAARPDKNRDRFGSGEGKNVR